MLFTFIIFVILRAHDSETNLNHVAYTINRVHYIVAIVVCLLGIIFYVRFRIPENLEFHPYKWIHFEMQPHSASVECIEIVYRQNFMHA